MGELLLY